MNTKNSKSLILIKTLSCKRTVLCVTCPKNHATDGNPVIRRQTKFVNRRCI